MDAELCKKGQVRINGRCTPHKIFGKVSGIKNITTEHHTKGSDTFKIDIGNDTNVELWQGPPDYKTKKRTIFFTDVHVKEKLTPLQVKKLNQISKQMGHEGIMHAKGNFISISPKKIVTKEKYKGDDIIYTYRGSMNYMPQKKGLKSGWTGFHEIETYRPTRGGELKEVYVHLDLTESVLRDIANRGHNLKTEEGESDFEADVSNDDDWLQDLLSLAKEDFAKARRK